MYPAYSRATFQIAGLPARATISEQASWVYCTLGA